MKFHLCFQRFVPMSSVVVCVPISGWECNFYISISQTIVGISEYAGETHIRRLHYQFPLFACIVQNSGRTEQNSYGLCQNWNPVNITPVFFQFFNAVCVSSFIIILFFWCLVSVVFNLCTYDQILVFLHRESHVGSWRGYDGTRSLFTDFRLTI